MDARRAEMVSRETLVPYALVTYGYSKHMVTGTRAGSQINTKKTLSNDLYHK